MASLVGSRVERKEDKRFLTGKGRYTADINLANQTYAIFVRSPHARASIKKLSIDKALKSSGVVSILTGKEIADDKIGGLIQAIESGYLKSQLVESQTDRQKKIEKGEQMVVGVNCFSEGENSPLVSEKDGGFI